MTNRCSIQFDKEGLLLLEALLSNDLTDRGETDAELSALILVEVQNGLGNMPDDLEYADMTEAQLAQVSGKFQVGDSPTEFDNLLYAIRECEYVAKKFRREVVVHEWLYGDWNVCWEVDGREGA